MLGPSCSRFQWWVSGGDQCVCLATMSLTDDARIDHVVVGYAEKVVDRFPVGSFDSSLRPVAAVAGPLGEEGDAVVW